MENLITEQILHEELDEQSNNNSSSNNSSAGSINSDIEMENDTNTNADNAARDNNNDNNPETAEEAEAANVSTLEQNVSNEDLQHRIRLLEAIILRLDGAPNRPIMGPTHQPKERTPTNLKTFSGKRHEDVNQWLFSIENTCKINKHIIFDQNMELAAIAGSALTAPANGWFLNWCKSTPSHLQSWRKFREDIKKDFESSNYQASVRKDIRELKQTGDIEDYNGSFDLLIYRCLDMSEYDQVSNYIADLKPKTQSHVKLINPSSLGEAMDQAKRYEFANFNDQSGDNRGGNYNKFKSGFKGNKQFNNGNYKKKQSSRFHPYSKYGSSTGNNKKPFIEKRNCHHCRKPGHIKKDCPDMKNNQGNVRPRQT